MKMDEIKHICTECTWEGLEIDLDDGVCPDCTADVEEVLEGSD